MSLKNRILGIAAAGVAASAVFFLAAPVASQEGKETLPPLIRRDRIPAVPKKFPPLKRDPFTNRIFTEFGEAGPSSAGLPPISLPGRPDDPAAASESAGPPPPDIRYVGCILGKVGRTALVLFDGQALAVSAGEELPRGWKTGTITETSFEAIDPEGKSRTILLEGEGQ